MHHVRSAGHCRRMPDPENGPRPTRHFDLAMSRPPLRPRWPRVQQGPRRSRRGRPRAVSHDPFPLAAPLHSQPVLHGSPIRMTRMAPIGGRLGLAASQRNWPAADTGWGGVVQSSRHLSSSAPNGPVRQRPEPTAEEAQREAATGCGYSCPSAEVAHGERAARPCAAGTSRAHRREGGRHLRHENDRG
jgi:hypothetical protein